MSTNIKLNNANGASSQLVITNPDTNFNGRTIDISKVAHQVDTIADLRAMTEKPDTVYVTGYHIAGDGAFGSHFFKRVDSAGIDNTGTIIVPNGVTTYYYALQYEGAVNVKWFGAVGDGVTNNDIAFTECFALKGKILIPKDSDYIVTKTFALGSNTRICGEAGTSIIAGLNDISVFAFDSTLNGGEISSNSSLEDVNISAGAGITGVTGVQLVNFRHSSYLKNVEVSGTSIGIHAKQLNWGTYYTNLKMNGCTTGYIIEDGSNGSNFIQCSSDGCTTGMIIRDGTTYPTTTVNIVRGFHQNCTIGIIDSARNTKLNGVYFEKCTDADISTTAIFSQYLETYHSGNSGTVCIKARNASAIKVENIVQDGTRTTGLFDFDTTNAYCFGSYQRTAAISTVEGVTTGIKLKTNLKALTAGNIGLENGVLKGITGTSPATYATRSLTNNMNMEATISGTVINANKGNSLFGQVVGDGGASYTVSNLVAGQSVTLMFKCSSGYSSGNISINGKVINMTNVAADKYTIVTITHSGLFANDFLSDNVWN